MYRVVNRALSSESLAITPINEYHKGIGGTMVPFAGYDMPVEYKDFSGGVKKEHLHCREHAGLFDVSHMGQLKIHGADRHEFLNKLVVAEVPEIAEGTATLSLITNERGGIIDDTIITNFSDHIFMVINAGCKHKDIPHLQHHLSEFRASGKDASIEIIEDRGLIALQGPKAAANLQKYMPNDVDLSQVKFMNSIHTYLPILDNTQVIVSRCGYTGEDGFEISVTEDNATKLFDLFITASNKEVLPIGLGARDSLRMEAGLCLYGHDLEEDITPVEAALMWTVGKKKKKEGGYLGAEHVLEQQKNGASRKRCGFILEKGPSAREGAELEIDGEVIGLVTSGSFSPILKKAFGMAYFKKEHSKVGTEFKVLGKKFTGKITKMPFVPAGYYR